MVRLEVRCCCRPDVLLGSCDWPDILVPRYTVTRLRASTRLDEWKGLVTVEVPHERFTFGLDDIQLEPNRNPSRAVKAEDAPQWALEALPGWEAAR